ncbi:MAG: hypothetical protein IPM63_18325 [Acidobacteriota bacterium]|nr:MAG: hypothetical protein IPM63_18325 [Acidobacteriota bacterium]
MRFAATLVIATFLAASSLALGCIGLPFKPGEGDGRFKWNNDNPVPQIKWEAGAYLGIRLGKSRLEDVVKKFGEPNWSGEPEEKTFEEDGEDEILIQYMGKEELEGPFDIIVGKDSKVVKAITIYLPKSEKKKAIISRFGDDFYEVASWQSLCRKPSTDVSDDEPLSRYPISMVYPKLGLYVSFREDGSVIHIGYLYKCI